MRKTRRKIIQESKDDLFNIAYLYRLFQTPKGKQLHLYDILQLCKTNLTILRTISKLEYDDDIQEVLNKVYATNEMTWVALNKIFKKIETPNAGEISIKANITSIIADIDLIKLNNMNNDDIEQIQENKYMSTLISRGVSIPRIARHTASSHDKFSRFMFNEIEGKYLATPFDKVFNDTVDKVFTGQIKRLIINMPVGMGKTARGLNAIISRGFAVEPRSKFLAVSYDNTLIQLNSSIIKDFISTPNYRLLYDVELKTDSTAKGLWRTKQGGALRAVSSGSGITGFRAGNITIKGFSGCLIIDDPLKPDDANSNTKMEHINNRYENTFKSRLAHEDIPIIVIMQRLHRKDFTNHLLEKYGKDWHHLIIPAHIEDVEPISSKGNIIHHNLPIGALWSDKYNLSVLEREKITNPSYYYSQLQQSPTSNSGSKLVSSKWINRYSRDELAQVKFSKLYMFADTANKTESYHDFSVFTVIAQSTDGALYVIDLMREKLEFHNLVDTYVAYYNYYTNHHYENIPRLSLAHIEDKASGISLIQVVRARGINVIGIQRSKDKVYRLSNIVHYIRKGMLYIPNDMAFTSDIIKEFDEFTEDDTHEHDDIIDTIIDAFEQMMIQSPFYNTGIEYLNIPV